MAKKKKSRRTSKRVSLLTLASFTPLTYETVRGFQQGGFTNAMAVFTRNLTGYDPQQRTFNVANMKTGLFPIVGVAILKRLLSALGVNRAFNKLPIPISL